ncbi:MAG: hypothetical protein M1820_000825 [Bogoriella megaspora]|nr:MAG: hypothetical protein M1820_000825 [Bogoriella megaspora]
MMSELLDFVVDHEKAFQSPGRLASLYSDFRIQATTNPDGYQANISAWKKALADAAKAGYIPSQGGSNDLLAFRMGEELLQALESKRWGRPLALGSVIGDAVAGKEMIPLKDFLSSSTSIYQKSWAVSPWQVIQWGLRAIGLTGNASTGDSLSTGDFVITANVEAAANAIIAHQATIPITQTSSIYSLPLFTRTFSESLSPSTHLSRNDILILLTHLSRDRYALSHDPSNGTVKFQPLDGTTIQFEPITEQDTAIASLKTLLFDLNSQIPTLTHKIAEAERTAREMVASGSISGAGKTRALAALRSKKLAEKGLEERSKRVAELEETLAKIEQAADNVEFVNAMRDSAIVLKGLNEKVGGAEHVQDVVDGLREEMQKVDEVSDMVREVGVEGVDEEEVDEEFEALEREAREKEEKRKEKEQQEKVEKAAEETKRQLMELDDVENGRKEAREKEEKRKEKEIQEKAVEETRKRLRELDEIESRQEEGGEKETPEKVMQQDQQVLDGQGELNKKEQQQIRPPEEEIPDRRVAEQMEGMSVS